MNAPRAFKYFDLVTVAFVAVLLISNIASSAKIVDWGIAPFGLRLAFDAGTLLFPLSYIFGDILTEVYGFARSRRVIWCGFGASALLSLCLFAIARMPGEAEWQGYAGDQAFTAILGGLASGGIIAASLLAYVAGEFCNSYILAKMKVFSNGRHLWARTIGSTLVGQAVDTGVFVCIACSLGVFPWSLAWTLIVANYVFKTLIEIVFTPVTYAAVRFLKRSEHEDYYDRTTNFNPLSFS